MALNENIMVRITSDTSDYTAKMQAAKASANDFGNTLESKVSTSAKFENALTNIGTAVGAASLAVGVTAVRSFADFDAAMSEVNANTGATSVELAALKDAALDAGARTVYSATESAQAINELGKAGMSTADILNGGLNGALDLAASDGMEVAQAAEYMSSALAMFHLDGTRAADVADALAAGAGKALGEVSDFGEALNNCGAQAYSFGMSMEETVGVLALFAENGMVGADAGTQLNSMLQKLAAPSKEAAGLMEELGIHAYDAGGNFVGMAKFAGQLRDAEADLTQEQRNAANATIFGSYAVKGANYLYEAGEDKVRKWTAAVSETGYASEIAKAKTNNLKGDLEQLGGAIETSMLRIGEGANGPLRKLVQMITDVVDAFGSLDPKVQQTALIVAGSIGTFAALHKVFGHLQGSSSNFGRQMGLIVDPVQRGKAAIGDVRQGLEMMKVAFASPEAQIETFGSTISKSQGIMQGLKTAGWSFIDMLGGPWGVALTVGATMLGSWIEQQQRAKERVSELTEAIKSGADEVEYFNDALGKSEGSMYTEGFLNKLKNGFDNVWDACDKVGISHEKFIRAIQGDQGAYDSIVASASEWYKQLSVIQQWYGSDASNVVLESLAEQQATYKKAVEEAAAAEEQAKTQARDKTAALLEGGEAAAEYAQKSGEMADADQILADQFGATTDGINDMAAALSEVIDAMNTYYSFSRNADEAMLNLRQGYLDCAEAIKKNGATLDDHTEKGIKNRKALLGIASDAYKAAEAQAQNGATMEQTNATMNEARDKFLEFAKAMGATPQEAEKLAASAGLSTDAIKQMIDEMQRANGQKVEVKAEAKTEEATDAISRLGMKVQHLPDGTVQITGDNTQALAEIAEVVGAKIDPKTGVITGDKTQLDAVMALANGAKIDPKTGYLKGDHTDYWNKICKVRGWKIDPKTGVIRGENGQAIRAINDVNNKKVTDKYFTVSDNGTAALAIQQIGRLQTMQIGNKSYTVTTYYTSQGEKVQGGTIPKGNARGGYITGPGTGTSDSILSFLSNGEYVVNARATARYKALLDAINYGSMQLPLPGYAAGGLVATPAEPYIRQAQETQAMIQYLQNNEFRMYTIGSPQAQADLIAAKIRFKTGR